jgi:hypothetical protein
MYFLEETMTTILIIVAVPMLFGGGPLLRISPAVVTPDCTLLSSR